MKQPVTRGNELPLPEELSRDAAAIEMIKFLDHGGTLIKYSTRGKAQKRWINVGKACCHRVINAFEIPLRISTLLLCRAGCFGPAQARRVSRLRRPLRT